MPQVRWGANGSRYGKNNHTTRSKFWNAICKYGWDNFDHIVIDELFTYSEVKLLEQIYILMFDSKDNGYNMTLGGDGSKGCHPSAETRAKIGFSARRENLSPETRRKLHECHLKENLSEETRRKLSESGKNRTTGFIKGSKHTEETKEKMRRAQDKYRLKVICLNSLEVFADANTASEFIDVSKQAIRVNCRGTNKSAGHHPITKEVLRWMNLKDY